MTTGVYGIFDKRDGVCLYVGQSGNVEVRLKAHLKNLKSKHVSSLDEFIEWFHANGADTSILDMKLLETCENTDQSKNLTELKWYTILNPTFAGKIPSENEKWALSDETKAKISASFKSKYRDINCSFCGETFRGITRETCNGTCRENLKAKSGARKNPKEINGSESSGTSRKMKASKEEIFHPCLHCKNPIPLRNKFCNKSCAASSKSKKISLSFEELYDLYVTKEMSSVDIGNLVAMSAPTVRKLLRELDIPIRSKNSIHTTRTKEKISLGMQRVN